MPINGIEYFIYQPKIHNFVDYIYCYMTASNLGIGLKNIKVEIFYQKNSVIDLYWKDINIDVLSYNYIPK